MLYLCLILDRGESWPLRELKDFQILSPLFRANYDMTSKNQSDLE